jgi:peptide/nickel transport system ATP-binding protein
MTTDFMPDPIDRGGPSQPMLIVRELRKHFPIKGGLLQRQVGAVKAVDGVSFELRKGETLGIVGESGCGKSTTARLINWLIPPDSGEVIFDGDQVGARDGISVRDMRRQTQMVFQDSYSSLNPRLPIIDSIIFGPVSWGVPREEARALGEELLDMVGLDPSQFARRYPHQLSGGQRQRVNIARALAMRPRLIVLDEAVSALDKSVEAQVLNLLRDLKDRFNLTFVFISHDLNVVQFISDRVLVMYLGHVVEIGPVDDIYTTPLHPYTGALLASRSAMDPDRRITVPPLAGDPPSPANPPSGCPFRTRCDFAEPVCAATRPALAAPDGAAAHQVACHARQFGSGHSRAPTMAARAASKRPFVAMPDLRAAQ